MISPTENGGDSANVLSHLDEWVLRQKPDVVHLNCGLHDLKRFKADGHHQVELARYAENLRRIVARIREGTDAALVFADTTPILDERHARRARNSIGPRPTCDDTTPRPSRSWANSACPSTICTGWSSREGPETMLGPDGTHYTVAGSDRLAEAVADCVLRQLTVRRYRPLPRPASGPQAAAEYRKAAASRDALVPEAYRRLKVGEFHIPADAGVWKEQRPTVLRTVVDSLGDLPPRPSPSRARIISRELRPGYTLEKVSLGNGVDGEVTALMLVPEGRKAAGAGHPLAPLLDPRQDAGDHPRDQRRHRIARRDLRSCGLRRALTRLLLARRSRRHRAVGHSRIGPDGAGGSVQAQPVARPDPLGHVRPGRPGRARLPLQPCRKWTHPASVPPA